MAKIILKVEIKVKNINIANSFVQKCVVPNSLQCYLFIWAWISAGSSLYDCFLQVCYNYWFVLCSELFISGHTHKSVSYLPLQSWQRWTTMNETFQSSRRHKRGSLTWPNFFSLLGFLHKHMKESARKMNNASIFLYLLCQGPAVSPPYPENNILTRCWRAKLHVYHIITFLSPVSHHFFLMYVCVCMDTERHQGRSYFLVFIWINYIDLSHFFSLHQAYSLRIQCNNERKQTIQRQSCAAQRIPPFTLLLDNILYRYSTSILYVYIFVTVTKIRYVTVDARLYTQGENKTQKSCTVLIEGKDTHDC